MGFSFNGDVCISVNETEVASFVWALTVRIVDEEGGSFTGTFGSKGCSFELYTENGSFAMTDTSPEDGIAVLRCMTEDRSNMALAPKAVATLPAVVELLEQFPYGLFNKSSREKLLNKAYSKIKAALAATA